jgi:hypothetical protein
MYGFGELLFSSNSLPMNQICKDVKQGATENPPETLLGLWLDFWVVL